MAAADVAVMHKPAGAANTDASTAHTTPPGITQAAAAAVEVAGAEDATTRKTQKADTAVERIAGMGRAPPFTTAPIKEVSASTATGAEAKSAAVAATGMARAVSDVTGVATVNARRRERWTLPLAACAPRRVCPVGGVTRRRRPFCPPYRTRSARTAPTLAANAATIDRYLLVPVGGVPVGHQVALAAVVTNEVAVAAAVASCGLAVVATAEAMTTVGGTVAMAIAGGAAVAFTMQAIAA